MKHWIENIAEELSKRDTDKHVIASGTSISGLSILETPVMYL